MKRALLRGFSGGAMTAVYLNILLIFTYFNYNPEVLKPITEFVFPLGCAAIALCFADKERISKWLVSAVLYAAAFLAVSAASAFINLPALVYRVFYGLLPENMYDAQTVIIISVSCAYIVLGMILSLIAAIAGSVRINRLIDSLEVKKPDNSSPITKHNLKNR